MAVPHPLPDALAELIAERFRVMGEPMRIRILDRLRAREMTVGELAEALGTSQQNVSKHVGLLAGAGIVAREKAGTSVRCRIADESVMRLCEEVCGGLERRIDDMRALLATEAAR